MQEMALRLDEWGKPAWIALMVVGFIVFWPIGLALLAYMIWSGRMSCGRNGDRSRWQNRMQERWDRHSAKWQGNEKSYAAGYTPSGNRAFDDYREQTLKRLEEEQHEFRDFLERLRLAKDRAEFDQFMTDRKSRPAPAAETPSAA